MPFYSWINGDYRYDTWLPEEPTYDERGQLVPFNPYKLKNLDEIRLDIRNMILRRYGLRFKALSFVEEKAIADHRSKV